jgi:hypothetical protein
MIYEDYLKVALKHLRTCEYLKDNLSRVNHIEKKDAILRNLYYLCGYVLEGIINYGIYKKYYNYRPNQPVKPIFYQIPTTNDWLCYNFPNDSEKRNDPILASVRNWTYRIAGHDYMKNKEFIRNKLNAIPSSSFSHIDIFLNRGNRNNPLVRLFRQWNVNTVRYESSTTSTRSSINYNETDIVAFFEFVKETYRVLPNLL